MHAHFVQPFVGCVVHVAVSLRVGQKRAVAGLLDPAERARHVRRRVPCGCLHKDGVVLHRQEVTLCEALLEQGVEHVFRRKVELYGTAVGRLELCEALLQRFGGVGHVLHDVRGAPDFLDSDFFVVGKYSEGVLEGPDAVVHTEEDVAVTVSGSLEHSALKQ